MHIPSFYVTKVTLVLEGILYLCYTNYNSMKILIVGGVAGGATAATRLRRLSEENQIIIFERSGYVSFANCGLPYHIGGTISQRDKLLLQTPQSLKSRYNLDARVRSEVVSIDRVNKSIEVKNLETGAHYTETYDKLLLSPGADPIRPAFPGVQHPKILSLRNIEDMDRIIESTKQENDFVVVGGGFIGLEVAENLIEKGKNVTLVELSPQVMAPVDIEFASFLHEKARGKGLKILLQTGVERFNATGEGLEVTLSNGQTLQAGAVILAIGVRPENTLAKAAGLAVGVTGGIEVNRYLQTSDPDIYAVGDAIEVKQLVSEQPVLIPLAWPANRQGRLVADNLLYGNTREYQGTLGSSILKFFELSVAATGLNEKMLKKLNIPYQSIIITKGHHAGYYPGAKDMVLKVLFDPKGGILGAQAVGEEGVDKRIDIIATAMHAGLKVQDLQEIEITYAPPFNSAKDLINIAGDAAENILNGTLKVINHDALWDYQKANDALLIDVRTKEEFSRGHIPGAINHNVDELRALLPTLDPTRKYIIYCQVGLRGYLANKILSNHGFDTVNLQGGYHLWNKLYPQNN